MLTYCWASAFVAPDRLPSPLSSSLSSPVLLPSDSELFHLMGSRGHVWQICRAICPPICRPGVVCCYTAVERTGSECQSDVAMETVTWPGKDNGRKRWLDGKSGLYNYI